ncbi:GNAT family N-acetyltransferase [Fidelibacter multiformis]|jgi:ribosomal protein S18 acetylase RimI-like enzyme|uniref:GNAT family N-acetyltransferase n=1 Tax=Fidelibacter multiformis TaxID=3377529 RepID=UPI0037DD1D19
MKRVNIRTYRTSDYEAVKNLWEAAGLYLSLSDTREELHKMLDKHPELFLIAEVNDVLVGTVLGSFDGRRGYVHHLAVLPEFQNRGFGSALLKVLEDTYRRMGVVKIHLFIETVNAEVESYYQKKGWHRRDDLIMMSKTLRTDS